MDQKVYVNDAKLIPPILMTNTNQGSAGIQKLFSWMN